MKTPEGALKAQIKKELDKIPNCIWYMPVHTGYGQQTVDFICCINGLFVAIETKSPGKEPTPRQYQFLSKVNAAGGFGFWTDSFEDFLFTLRTANVLP